MDKKIMNRLLILTRVICAVLVLLPADGSALTIIDVDAFELVVTGKLNVRGFRAVKFNRDEQKVEAIEYRQAPKSTPSRRIPWLSPKCREGVLLARRTDLRDQRSGS